MSRALGLRSLSFLLILGGIGWTFYLTATSIAEPSSYIPSSWSWLAVATLLVTGSLALNAVIFWLLLSETAPQRISLGMAARLHLVGQVVRYLPGRFWGVVYQVGAARDSIGAAAITRANIELMLFSLCGNLVVAGVILGVRGSLGLAWATGLVALGLIGLFALLSGTLGRLWRLGAMRLPMPTRIRGFLAALTANGPASLKMVAAVAAVFLLSWAWYVAAWLTLGRAFLVLADADLAALCALYTAAWMIGFVSALTPAGLGVREAAFLFLAQGEATSGVAAFIAIFVRVWLMVADLLLLPAVIRFKLSRATKHG